MTQSTLTAENSIREQLQQRFEQMAHRSFDQCMDSLLKVNFYDEVLRRIDRGGDISDEAPEAVGVQPKQLMNTIEQLRQQAEQASRAAWELSAALAGSFKTKVTAVRPQGELIPQFTVEHAAKNHSGQVRVTVKTWRRNVVVDIVGTDAGLSALNAEMAFGALAV